MQSLQRMLWISLKEPIILLPNRHACKGLPLLARFCQLNPRRDLRSNRCFFRMVYHFILLVEAGDMIGLRTAVVESFSLLTNLRHTHQRGRLIPQPAHLSRPLRLFGPARKFVVPIL